MPSPNAASSPVHDRPPVADAQPLVRLEAIGVRFGGRRVLDGVSLTVRRGEIVTLIGPNGAGKTTLARVVLGLVKPDAGRVDMSAGTIVGYVPQRLAIDPVLPLSVERLMSLTRRAGRNAVHTRLSEVGADGLLDRQVQTLSGGEMQRVLLARALLRDPGLLVLDEPTQNVDHQGQVELYDLIRRIRDDRGCGVVLISHDLHVVMAATDQVLCLNRHVCCAGTPEDVSGHPEYQALFGPRAADSVAVYRHAHTHRHTLGGEVVGVRNGADRADGGCGHDHDDGAPGDR